MSRLQFEMRLRDREVSMDVDVLYPDEEVGIKSFWFEDLLLHDLDGNELDWVLTRKELEAIGDEVERIMTTQETK